MEAGEQIRALEEIGELDTVERALHGKLRAHRLSQGFIERHGEDAIQQALSEYEQARARGAEIGNPAGYVVLRAYSRALDELRRELREVDVESVEAAVGAARCAEPFSPTEESALDNVSVAELRSAIAKLSTEQRQALGLYYFEERTTREAAAMLGCGQTTFRRRLDAALGVLRERFGVAAPEPGSELAVEIGLLAWASFAGARSVPNGRFLDQVIAGADALRSGGASVLARGRETAARLLGSGGGEGIGGAASGPLAKIAGGCVGAAVICGVGAGVGPRVATDLFGSTRPHHSHPHVSASPGRTSRVPALADAGRSAAAPAGAGVPAPIAPQDGKPRRTARQAERKQVEAQTSGIARAASESSAPPGASSSTAGGAETTTVPAPTPSRESASEEAQAEKQFGGFR